jgi:hypothetical protein
MTANFFAITSLPSVPASILSLATRTGTLSCSWRTRCL